MLIFSSKYVYKMQLYLWLIHNILTQQNNFEWTTEHQKRLEQIKTFLIEELSNTIPDPDQPIFFFVRRLQFWRQHIIITISNWNKLKELISANFRLLKQAELRLSNLMSECTAKTNSLTDYELLIHASKHPTLLFTDRKPIIFLFTQK